MQGLIRRVATKQLGPPFLNKNFRCPVFRIRRLGLLGALCVCGFGTSLFAEVELGGRAYVLAEVRNSPDHSVNVYYQEGMDSRNWEERLQVHYFPRLRQPRKMTLELLDRLNQRYPDLTYWILSGSTETEAGLMYLIASPEAGEARLDFFVYLDVSGEPGLYAYQFTTRITNMDARYGRTLLRGKRAYLERAFREAAWPEFVDETPGEKSVARESSLAGPAAKPENLGEPDAGLSYRSLSVRLPEGRVLLVDEAFREEQPMTPTPPTFAFAVPADTENLYIEYQGEGVPSYLKLSRTTAEQELVENLRFLPFPLEDAPGLDRLESAARLLRERMSDIYLQGWSDVRIQEGVATKIGSHDALVYLASFTNGEGSPVFARFTLVLPTFGDLAVLAYSQVDPRHSSVKRLEDLESGGFMAGVAHSLRYIDEDGLPQSGE